MLDFFQVILEKIFNVEEPSLNLFISLIIIGLILKAAFKATGFVFDKLGIYDSDAMSDFNKFIRCILILVALFLFSLLGEAINWLKGNLLVFSMFCGILIVFVTLYRVFSHLYSKKYRKKTTNTNLSCDCTVNTSSSEGTQASFHIKNPQIKQERNLCPRCGSKLHKMHGPYGAFWGCEAYFTPLRCKYTRKYF